MKDLDDKSKGMEILMAEDFAKINPTDLLILGKQATRRKRKWLDSSGMSVADASRCTRNGRFFFLSTLLEIYGRIIPFGSCSRQER